MFCIGESKTIKVKKNGFHMMGKMNLNVRIKKSETNGQANGRYLHIFCFNLVPRKKNEKNFLGTLFWKTNQLGFPTEDT